MNQGFRERVTWVLNVSGVRGTEMPEGFGVRSAAWGFERLICEEPVLAMAG